MEELGIEELKSMHCSKFINKLNDKTKYKNKTIAQRLGNELQILPLKIYSIKFNGSYINIFPLYQINYKKLSNVDIKYLKECKYKIVDINDSKSENNGVILSYNCKYRIKKSNYNEIIHHIYICNKQLFGLNDFILFQKINIERTTTYFYDNLTDVNDNLFFCINGIHQLNHQLNHQFNHPLNLQLNHQLNHQ